MKTHHYNKRIQFILLFLQGGLNMKLFKKLFVTLLALLLIVGCGQTGSSETDGETSDSDKTLIVGSTGELNGHYIAGVSNSSYDKWVRNLLWDYGLYATDEGGQFVLNETVVDGEPVTTENADGSKTYQFKIKEGLVWSDETPITAKDYVFDVLFTSSGAPAKAGATGGYDQLVGYSEYKDGTSKSFAGVKLVDDYTFELTIAAENLPYFYEVAAVAAAPSPMHVWSPNLQIGEDGASLVTAEGYELTEQDKADYADRVQAQIDTKEEELAGLEGAEEPDQESIDELKAEIDELKAEKDNPTGDASDVLLQSAAYFVYQEEIFAPSVTSGAYTFVNFENQSATVELNPLYVGNFRGEKPTIKRVEVRNVNEKLDVDMVISGEIDITAGVIEGEKIEKARASEEVTAIDYKRNGYGLLAFHVDKEPVNHKEVRQAVAWLMDRQAFVDGVLGGYGEIGQGMYGLSQWTYQMKGQEFMDAITERDTVYTLNIDKANELLDQTDYKFEADGTTPWDPAKALAAAESDGDNFSYWRYNSKGEELLINHAAGSEDIGNIVNGQLTPNGRQAGLHYIVNNIDFNTLLTHYYNFGNIAPADRTYHAYTLATSFTPVFDPYYSFHTDWYGTQNNTNQVQDADADRITKELRQIDPTDTEAYANKWLEFQLWFNDYLPNIPLYSNQYFDIYNNRITGLETTPDWDWSMDIADISFTE